LAGYREQVIPCTTRQFVLKRQYCYTRSNGFTLSRTINKFCNTNDELCRYYIVSYKLADEHGQPSSANFMNFSKIHGNAKNSKDMYHRTKPSVINAIGNYGKTLKPKEIISAIEKDSGGCYSSASKSDVVRDRRQVYNKIRNIPDRPKARNTGKVKITD